MRYSLLNVKFNEETSKYSGIKKLEGVLLIKTDVSEAMFKMSRYRVDVNVATSSSVSQRDEPNIRQYRL